MAGTCIQNFSCMDVVTVGHHKAKIPVIFLIPKYDVIVWITKVVLFSLYNTECTQPITVRMENCSSYDKCSESHFAEIVKFLTVLVLV